MRRFRDLRATPLAILLVSVVLAATASLLAVTARRIAAPRTAHERTPKKTKAPRAPSGNGRQAQRASSGVGPLLHRRYIVDIPRTRGSANVGANTLMRAIKRQMTSLSPEALARFRKSRGEPGEMRIGDEYHITMLGPWNGRVRVVAVATDSFTLITLKGHPESGHITFRVRERGAFGTSLRVSIESWARSRDSTVDLAYAKLGVGKHVQAEVWVTFLQRACELAGLEAAPRVRITSEEVNA